MKVAMLGWELPPFNSGGLGVACYQLCKALSRNGVDIDFILPYTGHPPVEFMNIRSASGVSIEQLSAFATAYQSVDFGLSQREHGNVSQHQHDFIKATEQLIAEGLYDVIHAHDWLTFRAAVRAKERIGVPLIVHLHSVEADRAGVEYGGNPLVREAELIGLQAADSIVAVSHHTKRAIVREYAIPADKVTVIHNSIDHEVFSDALSALSSDMEYQYLYTLKQHGWRVVMNVGRLTIQKGLDYLLQAAVHVVERAPKTLFVFVGSGEQRDELIMKAAEYGLADKVFLAGFQRGQRWREAFQIADLFVMPSVSEPFGLAPLEAIGYGTPALISKQSGVSEVMRNVLKVDFWDTHKLAEYITAVVCSDELRDELHANAMAEMINLSWHRQTPQFIGLYQRVLVSGATT